MHQGTKATKRRDKRETARETRKQTLPRAANPPSQEGKMGHKRDGSCSQEPTTVMKAKQNRTKGPERGAWWCHYLGETTMRELTRYKYFL